MSHRITLRLATIEDDEFFFALRTDAETVKQSTRPAPSWPEHESWMESSLASPTRRLFVAFESTDSRSIGTGRLDHHGEEVEVSWAVAPDSRRMGYGRELIRGLLEYARTIWPGVQCTAQIKPENVASLRAAFAAGFRLTGSTMLRLEA